jgi:type IV fimbrial biogenesis protein FimT
MKSQSGMTMTELVIVMAIVGILLGLGVPSYRYVTNSNRMSSEVNALLGDMQLARSQALREGNSVAICISSNGTTCAGSTTYTWQSGWVVYSDLNNDGVLGANDPILRVQKQLTSSDDFQDVAKTVSQIRFNREGFATGLPNAGALLVLHDKTSNRVWTRCLSISMVGMLTTQTNATNSSCL